LLNQSEAKMKLFLKSLNLGFVLCMGLLALKAQHGDNWAFWYKSGFHFKEDGGGYTHRL